MQTLKTFASLTLEIAIIAIGCAGLLVALSAFA